MRYLGYEDAQLTVIGPDEGVDVTSSRAMAQVKSGDTPTGRPVVQQIYGVAALNEKEPMLFSVAPITEEAKEWAARAAVALFRLDLSGAAIPANPRAADLFAGAIGRLTGWQAVRAEVETLIRERRDARIAARFDVPDGYRGYWSIRHPGDGTVLVSRDFAGSGEQTAESVNAAVDLLEAKLRELGVEFYHCEPVITVDGVSRPFRPRLNYPVFDDPEDGGSTLGQTADLTAGIDEPADIQEAERSARLGGSAFDVTSAPIRITATDVYQLFGSPHCERRLYLKAHGVAGSPPSALQEMLRGLGAEAEQKHLADHTDLLDLSDGTLEERAERTTRLLGETSATVYQGVLRVELDIDGFACEVVGVPDFLIPREGGHVIRDVKVARRIDEEERPDIAAQLRVYDWLYEQVLDRRPVQTEVFAGDGTIHTLASGASSDVVMGWLAVVLQNKTAQAAPYCPVQFSASKACPYFDRCWNEAVGRRDPSIVPGVNAYLARWLHDRGIRTIDALRDEFTADDLAEIQVPHGSRQRRIGENRASSILRAVESLSTGTVIRYGPLELPSAKHLAILDLEASPSFGGRDGLVYLWGTCVKGPEPLPFYPAFVTGDLRDEATGWNDFLRRAGEIFERYGRATPFLHWATFEKTHITRCIEEYGDQNGIGNQVRDNLVDLYRIVAGGLTLPVYSYSLKQVEQLVGFERSQAEFGGEWSIAIWDDALSAGSAEDRQMLLRELAIYNEEDLEGLWAVFRWLRSLDGADFVELA